MSFLRFLLASLVLSLGLPCQVLAADTLPPLAVGDLVFIRVPFKPFREVAAATGRRVGQVQTFAQLLHERPDAGLGFWKLWYLGRIPWQRETITPASVLASPALRPVFDGAVAAP